MLLDSQNLKKLTNSQLTIPKQKNTSKSMSNILTHIVLKKKEIQ
jgi:hypothetical protein